MMRHRFAIGFAAAAFAMSLTPAFAQDRSRPADSPSVGSAVPRDSGSSSGSSSSGSSSGSTSTSSSGSSSGNSSSWAGSGGYEAPRRAPVNPEAYGDQRHGGGNTTTGRAVPRDNGNSASGSTSSSSSTDGDRQASNAHSRAIPAYSRPRDGRPVTGAAVDRPDGYYHDGYPYSYSTFIYNPYYSYFYDPYYQSRYYWNPWGYGFGFGYMAYDPFWFSGFGYPGYYGGGYYDPSGGGYYGGGGGYYGGGGGGYSSSPSQVSHGTGSLRLKVKPGNAQVFVDGYLVGTVDDFDGTFQRLSVEAGSHKIELRAPGYQTTEFEVVVPPGDTLTYKGEMVRQK
jgi:PEGA domain-containing protein